MTTEQVLADKQITGGVTRGMCCPTSDGGSAAIIASEDFVKKHNLQNQAIEIVGQSMTTDSPALYSRSRIELTGVSWRVRRRSLRSADCSPGRHDQGRREGRLQGGWGLPCTDVRH